MKFSLPFIGIIAILCVIALNGLNSCHEHEIQCEIIETIQINASPSHGEEARTIHIVEVGEHKYSIAVWGDNFEYTSAEHAEDCKCKK